MSDDKSQNDDNLEAAMEQVARTTRLSRKANTGSTPGAPAEKQVLIRASEADHERWKQAAEFVGKSLAEFVREVMNAKAAELLDCQHPLEYRRQYPWSDVCLKCGKRLK